MVRLTLGLVFAFFCALGCLFAIYDLMGWPRERSFENPGASLLIYSIGLFLAGMFLVRPGWHSRLRVLSPERGGADGPGAEARLTRTAWFRREFIVRCPGGHFTVTYNGCGFGEAVFVNGEEVARHAGVVSMSHRFEFPLGGHRAALTVAIPWWCTLGPLCDLTSVCLEVDGRSLYVEGRAPRSIPEVTSSPQPASGHGGGVPAAVGRCLLVGLGLTLTLLGVAGCVRAAAFLLGWPRPQHVPGPIAGLFISVMLLVFPGVLLVLLGWRGHYRVLPIRVHLMLLFLTRILGLLSSGLFSFIVVGLLTYVWWGGHKKLAELPFPPEASEFYKLSFGVLWLVLSGFGYFAVVKLVDRFIAARCPRCGGPAYREARAEGDSQGVGYRCHACGHMHVAGGWQG